MPFLIAASIPSSLVPTISVSRYVRLDISPPAARCLLRTVLRWGCQGGGGTVPLGRGHPAVGAGVPHHRRPDRTVRGHAWPPPPVPALDGPAHDLLRGRDDRL